MATEISTRTEVGVGSTVQRSSGNGITVDAREILTATQSADVGDSLDTGIKTSGGKKKKKKKSRKSSKPAINGADSQSKEVLDEQEHRPPTLCISRNKHWKYISSYHVRLLVATTRIYVETIPVQGPWLQLPLELLESLLVLNIDPSTVSSESRLPTLTAPPAPRNRIRERGFSSIGISSPPDSPQSPYSQMSMSIPPLFPPTPPGRAAPPPIDPGVFRSVASIRKLIDEAAELSVRASSGLTSAALGAMRKNNMNISGSPWTAMQSLGLNPMGDFGGGGRNVQMSANRIHRLRLLAVQKLAEAYKADEIASSVMVMQGGSVFDDIAEKVLKVGALLLARLERLRVS